MAIPNGWSNLGFTSGRRTHKGNRLVGGVNNSDHLRGTAADFTAPIDVLRRQFPKARILDEGDHRHVAGLADVPYHGNRGIAGLVNGVDTTAPKGSPMLQPRKPRPAQRTLGASLYPQPQYGADPLAPEQLNDAGLSFPAQPVIPDQQLAQLPQLPQPKSGKGMKTLGSILGIVGDSLSAYGGRPGVYAPFMAQQMNNEAEENRFQQRLAAEIQAKRELAVAKASEPPQWLQDAQAFSQLPTDAREQVIRFRDAMYPVVADVTDEQGRVTRQQMPRSLGAPKPGDVDDGYEYLGGDPASPQSWRRR